MMPVRRKDITDDTVLEILGDMSLGMSLSAACKCRGINTSTIWGRIQRSSKMYTEYTRARERRSDAVFEKMEELEEQVMNGKICPKAYRAASETMRWRLGKMKPKTFGDKQQVEHTGNISIASEITAARRASIIESIDAEPVQSAIAQCDTVNDSGECGNQKDSNANTAVGSGVYVNETAAAALYE